MPQNISASCATVDGRFAFAATKEGLITQYDMKTKQKVHVYPRVNTKKINTKKASESPKHGHTAGLLALAVSYDGKYLVLFFTLPVEKVALNDCNLRPLLDLINRFVSGMWLPNRIFIPLRSIERQ